MCKGAKIAFAEIEVSSVMETTETTLRRALDDVERNGANRFHCLTYTLVVF